MNCAVNTNINLNSASQAQRNDMRNVIRALNKYKLVLVALSILTVGLVLIVLPFLLHAEGPLMTIVEHLGLVFVPSGLMALVYEVMLRRTFMEDVREQFSLSLNNHFGTMNRLSSAGLVDVHDCLPDGVISEGFGSATSSIRILQTWIPNLLQIELSLARAIARGCNVRILLLDPASIHTVARNTDLGYVDKNTTRHSIELNLKQLACFYAEVGAKIEVRLYNATPVLSLYASDDTRFVGFFWRKRRSSQGPQFEVSGYKSMLALEADRHFEDLWECSRAVDFKTLLAGFERNDFTVAVQ